VSSSPSEQRDREKRKAFRFSLWKPQQQGVLKVKERELPVRMLDGSAGGFSVVTDRDPGMAVDDLLELRTPSGRFEVRVVHVRKEVPKATNGRTGHAPGALKFRVGLERLRDLTPSDEEPVRIGWLERLSPRGYVSSSIPLGVMAVVFVLAMVGLPTIGVMLLWRWQGQLDKHFAWWGGRQAATSQPDSPGGRKQPDHAAEDPQTRKPAGTARPASNAGQPGGATYSASSHRGQSWATTIQRLPGATALLLDEVVEELRLTGSQYEEIRKIVESTEDALRLVGERWSRDTRQQQSQKRSILLNQARRRALQVLTPEQRAQWEALQSGQGGD